MTTDSSENTSAEEILVDEPVEASVGTASPAEEGPSAEIREIIEGLDTAEDGADTVTEEEGRAEDGAEASAEQGPLAEEPSDELPGQESHAAAQDAENTAAAAAPETQTAVEPQAGPARPAARLPRWPFLVYDALWVVFAGLVAWQLALVPEGTATFDTTAYAYAVFVGVGLTALGPLVILAAWLYARATAPSDWRHGLFFSSLLAGAIATAFGVALWWVALLAVDYVRLGGLL